MSLVENLKKFFTHNKHNQQKQEEEIIHSLALAACEEKHNILIECYKTSLIGGCQTELDQFWKCVNEQKTILTEKAKSFKQHTTWEENEASSN